MPCPRCRSDVADYAAFCGQCGLPLEPMSATEPETHPHEALGTLGSSPPQTGWLPDPSGRWQYRYFDHGSTTDQVRVAGQTHQEPPISPVQGARGNVIPALRDGELLLHEAALISPDPEVPDGILTCTSERVLCFHTGRGQRDTNKGIGPLHVDWSFEFAVAEIPTLTHRVIMAPDFRHDGQAGVEIKVLSGCAFRPLKPLRKSPLGRQRVELWWKNVNVTKYLPAGWVPPAPPTAAGRFNRVLDEALFGGAHARRLADPDALSRGLAGFNRAMVRHHRPAWVRRQHLKFDLTAFVPTLLRVEEILHQWVAAAQRQGLG